MPQTIKFYWNSLFRYWFSSMPGTRLATVRICVGLFALWYFGRRADLYYDMARNDLTHFDPIGAAAWLSGPLPATLIDSMFWLMLILIIAFVTGCKYRFTAPALACLSLFLISYRNSWSMIYHTDNAMWLHILILAFAPAADHWSWDAWRLSQTTQQAYRNDLAKAEGGEYGWPLRLMALATGLAYFLSGFAKLAGESGWHWALGEPLRLQVAVDGLRKELFGSQAPELAFLLFEHVWLFTIAGIGTLMLELGAPLFMLHRGIGRLWALATYGMHLGIWLVMGITFEYCLTGVIFVFLFDVERPVIAVWQRLRAGVSHPAATGIPDTIDTC